MMRQKMRRGRYRVAAFATAVLASAAAVGLAPGIARADLPSGTFDLAAGGSDTTTPVLDAIAQIVTPGHQGSDSNVFDSFDATGSSTVNTTDFFSNQLGITCTGQTRPNGSGQGLKALAGTLSGDTLGCFQFSRASRPPDTPAGTVDPSNLTWVPFGQDIVDFAVTNTSDLPRTLTLAELQSIYQCQSSVVGTAGGGGPGIGGYNFNPVIPQSGSGTRLFWETLMGITDPSAFSSTNGLTTTPASLNCLIDGVNPAQTSQIWEEHTATLETDFEICPYSVAQYEIQAEGLITDQRGRSLLGDIQNTDGTVWQPQVPNAPGSQTTVGVPTGFEREIYNVVPTVDLGEAVTGASNSGTSVTIDFAATAGPGGSASTYGFASGGKLTVSGATGSWTSINGTWTVSSLTASSVTFTVTTAPSGSISGSVIASSQLGSEIQNVFIGSGSDFCSSSSFGGKVASTLLEYHVLSDSSCGTTPLHT